MNKEKTCGLVYVTFILFLSIFLFPVISIAGTSSTKTLKIGALAFLIHKTGVDFQKELQVMADKWNNEGGIDIGGENYKLDIVLYDDKLQPELGRTAVEKMIAEDIKFILGDDTVSAWSQLTEANKILVLGAGSAPEFLNQKNKMMYQATHMNTVPAVAWGWYSKHHPEYKTASGFFQDTMIGHAEANNLKQRANAFGQKVLNISYFPPNQADLSALATKVSYMNPDVFTSSGGGIATDPLAFKAVRNAGWKGHIWASSYAFEQLMNVMPTDMAEGMYISIQPVDLPNPSPTVKEFMNAWTEKYGKFDYPTIFNINTLYCLVAALKKAGSVDPERVAAVLDDGLTFESLSGTGIMIKRPDYNNNRAVDALFDVPIGKISGGKLEVLDTVSHAEGLEYLAKVFKW